MKENHQNKLDKIDLSAISKIILYSKPQDWKGLKIDYVEPHVNGLTMQFLHYRIHLHVISKCENKPLFHKHRWPAKFYLIRGSYEMGITYSEKEISSEEAHNLPVLCKTIMHSNSYYEMTQTDTLHYVKPLSNCYSIMITEDLYPEASFRKEISPKLSKLDYGKKSFILSVFKYLLKSYDNPNEA